MLLAENLLLLVTDDASGRLRVPADQLDPALAGAILVELTMMGRVDLSGEGSAGKPGRLIVSDSSPAGDEVLDEALRILEQYGRVHLLLTDVIMPVMGGRQLAERVVSLEPATKVVYMSGYTDHVVTAGGMLEKGLAFLQKPFSQATLAQKVREVLHHTPAA